MQDKYPVSSYDFSWNPLFIFLLTIIIFRVEHGQTEKKELNFSCWFFKAVLKHKGQELLTPLTQRPAVPVGDLGQ